MKPVPTHFTLAACIRVLVFAPALFVGAHLPGFAQPDRPPLPPPIRKVKPPPFYFPPNPPPLGAVIVDPPGAAADPERSHPLGSFVAELFYPPLSSAVFAVDDFYRLPRRVEKSVEEFRDQRAALLALIRARLPALATLSAGERRAAWEALSREHAADLAALEARAEEIRARLADVANWNEGRKWRLGRGKLAGPREKFRALEYFVVRAAVFYQDGLSPAQRRLLRERAMQLEGSAFSRANPPPPSGAFVWFSPDTTQVFLPPDTPRDIAAAFVDYAAHKAALQAEIQDAVHTQDRDLLELTRRAALARLAEQQTPRFAALEREAESLREAVARWGGLPRREFVAPWPETLRARVATYERKSAALEQEITAALATLMESYPPSPKTYGPARHEAHRQWKDERRAFEASERRRLEEEVFTAAHRELATLLDEIRAAITHEFGPDAVQEHSRPDGFLRNLQRVFRRGEAYYEYDLAVLEPGLSPELRRLLLSGALEKLELPLPGAEQPPSHLTEFPGL